MPTSKKTLITTFTRERATKGAVKYAEDGNPEQHKSGSLYLRKSALNGETPEKLKVRIEY